jgi:hypothetical protein
MPVVFAVLAAVAFFIAYLFHGAHFAPSAWIDWQGMSVAGLFFLALAGTGAWPRR